MRRKKKKKSFKQKSKTKVEAQYSESVRLLHSIAKVTAHLLKKKKVRRVHGDAD